VIRNLRATTPASVLVITLFLPILMLFMMGSSFSDLIPPFLSSGREIPYQAFLAAGVISLAVVDSSLAGGLSFWYDRNTGMMEQILTGPYRASEYLLSKVITSVLLGLVGAAVLSALAIPILFTTPISLSTFAVILSAILLASFFFGTFALIMSCLLKTEGTFSSVFNLLIIVLMFASSTFYPAESAPQILQAIFIVNPLTYTVDIIRFGLFELSTPFLVYEAIALISESIFIFVAAIFIFKRVKVV
jgi:ABC-2 type transport system permease protein